MTAVPRIAPRNARMNVEMGKALLVCAYEDPEKFQARQLEGAISLQEFRSHGASLSWDQEIIFYCDSPNEKVAASEAAKCRALGFSNAEVLRGGVAGWKQAGYGVV